MDTSSATWALGASRSSRALDRAADLGQAGAVISCDVTDLIRQRRAGHGLDRELYVSDGAYASDLERIWYREWLFVGHAAQLPAVGDYLTVAIGAVQLVLVRGGDATVRALHNVCRHRGSLICAQASGSVRRLVCPYHQWTYDLQGELIGVRHAPDDFDRSQYGLVGAACEVVAGMIFVSLADDPPDVGPLRALVERYLAPFDLEHAQVAATDTTVEAANWKLVMENNRECYHCPGAHPELNATFPEAPLHSGGGSAQDRRSLAEMVERCEQLDLPSEFEASPDNQFRAMRMPLANGARSMTLDGRPAVATRFGSLPDQDLGDVLLYHYPSTWNHFMADHAVTFQIRPLGPLRTQLTTTWLVPEGSRPGVDYDLDALTHVWRRTNAQDAALVERAQLGVSSPAFRPGPYTPDDETGVAQFVDWYCDRMLAAAER